MANFIRVIFFLVIVAGVGIYLLSNQPEIFQGAPQEKILLPAAKYVAPSAPASVSLPSVISPEIPTIPDYLIPSGYSREQLSSYFQKIRISSAYASSFYGGYSSEIRLYSYLPKEEKINITGWKIKGNKAEFFIPQAVNVYGPSGLSPQEDIIILGNAYINIYSNRSPVNVNLRLNKCTGYLGNNYNFNPALPQSCPSISRSEISYLSGQCQSYILSLWGCKEPDISFYNSLPGNDAGNACRAFLSTINWNSCFQKHYRDADFLSNEWRIWLNWTSPNDILDSQHDRVRIFDKQGLLVDEYIY